MTALDYTRFEALTFDCYGTLIDWEAGIVAGLRPALARRGIEASDDELLEVFAGYRVGRRSRAVRALPGHPRPLPARGRRPLRVRGGRARGRRVLGFGRRLAGLPGLRRRPLDPPRAVPARRDHQLRRRPVRPLGGPAPDDVRLGRDRAVGRRLQARRTAASRLAFERIGLPRTASCTSPRACSTTTCRPGALGSRRSGSIVATTGPGSARRRRPRRPRTPPSRTWPRSRRPRSRASADRA